LDPQEIAESDRGRIEPLVELRRRACRYFAGAAFQTLMSSK